MQRRSFRVGLAQIESGLASLSDETNTETSTTAAGTTPSALDLAKTLDESLTAMANTEGENNDVATMYNGAASLVKGNLADKLATAAKTSSCRSYSGTADTVEHLSGRGL